MKSKKNFLKKLFISGRSTSVGLLYLTPKISSDAIRLNFSHGSIESHTETARRVMQAREELGIPTALILDTKGPEIRTGMLVGDKDVELVAGNTFTLTTEEMEGDSNKVSVTYEDFAKDLKVGAVSSPLLSPV